MSHPSRNKLPGFGDFRGLIIFQLCNAFLILKEQRYLKIKGVKQEISVSPAHPQELTANRKCFTFFKTCCPPCNHCLHLKVNRKTAKECLVFFMISQILHSLEAFLFMKRVMPKIRNIKIVQSRYHLCHHL